MAKKASGGEDLLPKPPEVSCSAFLRADLRWLATVFWNRNPDALPVQAGQWFQWKAADQCHGASLAPEELVPTVATVSTKARAMINVRLLSVNLQGLRGKHAYVEEQLVWKGIQIAFLQETKDADGQTASRRFLRFCLTCRETLGNCSLVEQRNWCL